MAFRREARILERSYITGTGDIILAGAVDGYFSFGHRLADGDTFDYAIERTVAGLPVDEFEYGLGTFRTGPDRIERSVRGSSNADALVDFQTGPKKVSLVVQPPLELVAYVSSAGVGGNRAVRLDAGDLIYADNTVPGDGNRVLGITVGAASAGSSALVQTEGLMEESSWSWTPDAPIYLSTTGLLTQTVPTSGFVLILGFATSPTQMMIEVKMPITLI